MIDDRFRFPVSGFKPEGQVAGIARFFFGKPKSETIGLTLRSRGFSLLELLLVVVIIGVLATVVLDRMLYYQERAEKAMMDATLAAIKMGLQVRLAELIMTNRQTAVVQLERENPMRWLDEPPSTYRGEYRAPAETGSWYFAADARQLVYVPNKTSYLQWNQPDSKELRFQVSLRYEEIETAGGKVRAPTGVAILPTRLYRWF